MKKTQPSLVNEILNLAKEAGDAILEIYRSYEKLEITIKEDASPVTQADYKAHTIIQKGLEQLTPNIPFLSEESVDIPYEIRKEWKNYWLVDPLDGTKEFIHRTNEFTINIAYITENEATLGVIYVPFYDTFYYAIQDQGAYKQIGNQKPIQIRTRPLDEKHIVAMISRRHGAPQIQSFLSRLKAHELILKGSSLKTCLIAEGLGDVYPCLGRTSEWDMGAAQCIIEEAGGSMFDLQMQPIKFNTKDSLLNPPILIVGDASHDWHQYI